MNMASTVQTINNRLVHINLSLQVDNAGDVGAIMMRERPFVGELNLDIDPDNLENTHRWK